VANRFVVIGYGWFAIGDRHARAGMRRFTVPRW
jgi:hypothetical protein